MPMLCFLWSSSAPYNNVKYFVFPSVLSIASVVLSTQFGLFCDTLVTGFCLPSLLFLSFLLEAWSSGLPHFSSLASYSPHNYSLNASLNVRSSLCITNQNLNINNYICNNYSFVQLLCLPIHSSFLLPACEFPLVHGSWMDRFEQYEGI